MLVFGALYQGRLRLPCAQPMWTTPQTAALDSVQHTPRSCSTPQGAVARHFSMEQTQGTAADTATFQTLDELEVALTRFYAKYAPQKIDDNTPCLAAERFIGRQDELNAVLKTKYGSDLNSLNVTVAEGHGTAPRAIDLPVIPILEASWFEPVAISTGITATSSVDENAVVNKNVDENCEAAADTDEGDAADGNKGAAANTSEEAAANSNEGAAANGNKKAAADDVANGNDKAAAGTDEGDAADGNKGAAANTSEGVAANNNEGAAANGKKLLLTATTKLLLTAAQNQFQAVLVTVCCRLLPCPHSCRQL